MNCIAEGCTNPTGASGLCVKCYSQRMKGRMYVGNKPVITPKPVPVKKVKVVKVKPVEELRPPHSYDFPVNEDALKS